MKLRPILRLRSIVVASTLIFLLGVSNAAYVQGLRDTFEGSFFSDFSRNATGTFFVQGGPAGAPPLAFIFNVYAEGLIRISISTEGTTLTGFAFTDDQGVWRQTGRRELTAAVLALNYQPPGAPQATTPDGNVHSISLARVHLAYSKNFSRVSGAFNVNVYPPGTNPITTDQVPVFTIDFPFAGERLIVP